MRYEVLGQVASTRTGAVWKARDTRLDRLVALKQIPALERDVLHREAAAIAAIGSEHVVAVYGVEEDGPSTYLVEEWVDGATVGAVIRHNGPMPHAQALSVLRGALLGLADAHRAGLVHGDVSLSNVLIDAAGTARLIDFGSVTTAGSAARASTGAFAAPEVLAGAAVTPAADVYAAAGVLVALLRGKAEARPSTRGLPLGWVLDRALADDPAQRYPDAAAFLADLDAAAQREYGPAWWSQAGLGAAAAGVVAALVPVAVAVAGAAGAAGVATAGAGTVAGAGGAGTGMAGFGAVGGGGAGSSSAVGSAVGHTAGLSAGHVGTSTVGKAVGRGLWHGRRLFYGLGGVAATAATGVAIAVAVNSSGSSASTSANIIRNPGAENAKVNAAGTQVPVADWTARNGSKFTAVGYNADGFPAKNDIGPKDRGKNLFTGGETGDVSVGTQTDSLSSYRSRISDGNAKFTLSAYLGGYSSQGDSATLTVTWLDGSGRPVGTPTTLGPVTVTQRKDETALLPRSTSGSVPSAARSVLVTLRMVRTDGAYVDGYADNLSLTIK